MKQNARISFNKYIKHFHRDKKGVTAIMFALVLPLIIGFLGLGVEVSLWYKVKREMQGIVDAAVIAGAYEIMYGNNTAINSSALGEATRNGIAMADGDTFDLNHPPVSGAYTSDGNAIEVNVTRSMLPMFSALLRADSTIISSRAVATLGSTTDACVLALSGSAASAINVSGGSVVDLTGCAAAANSSSNSAITASNNSALNAECLYAVGGFDAGVGSSLNTTCTLPQVNTSAVADPYEVVEEPVIGACDYNNFSANGGTISPGTYCNGLTIMGSVTMQSGVYIIDRGTFKVTAGALLDNELGGVTIFLTSSTSSQYANVRVNGVSTVTLEAQDSGPYSGIVFYQDDDVPLSPASNNVFNGGSTMEITGALYFPNGNLDFSGGGSISGNCTQIIGQTVSFSGDSSLELNCDSAGTTMAQVMNKVELVE